MSESDLPDIYVDQFRITVGVYGANLTFGLSEAHPTPGGGPVASKDQVCIRMSLQHAKIVAMMMRKFLKNYERTSQAYINVPREIHNQLELPEEDW